MSDNFDKEQYFVCISNTDIAQNDVARAYKLLEHNITTQQNTITGTPGQFVVIGDDGNVTTKTVSYAEEASF